MKCSPLSFIRPVVISGVLAGLVSLTGKAADSTWTMQDGGDWSEAANWSSGIVAGGPGATATIEGSWINTMSIELDGAVSLGRLSYRDNGSVNRDMVLSSSGGHPLTLSGGGVQSRPEIEARNRRLTIRVALEGNEGLWFRGSQATRGVRLEAPCTYTGGTSVAAGAGTLEVMAGGQLGAGTLTVRDDGNPADVDVILRHAAALQTGTAVVLEANTTLDLSFTGGSQPVISLVIDGVAQAPGLYNATTHPAAFSGNGTLAVLTGPGTPPTPPPSSDGNWIDVTSTNVSWTDPAMWDGGTVAYGTDRIADFQNGGLNHQVAKLVDLPVDIVLGQLWWRDSGGVNRDLTITSSNSSKLIMASSSGSPLIWAKNRSIYLDVPIGGDDGIQFRSQQSTQPGVVIRHRNHYRGLTTIIDDNGITTVRSPGDFGDSDVLVKGNLADSGVELVLEHSLALRPHTELTLEPGAKVELGYPNLFPGSGDSADLYVSALTLAGTPMPPGAYSASTHPAFFEGTGEVIVQAPRDHFTMSADMGAGQRIDVSWLSLYGRIYDLEHSTSLAPGSWSTLSTELATPPVNAVNVPMPDSSSAFYRIGERIDYLPTIRAGVVNRIDELVSIYLGDQNLTLGDIRHGQFHNSDNMRQSECTPVLVWAYRQPDSAHYRSPAVLDSAIWSMDHMVRAQGINGGYNEYHGWCGVPNRTNGKSSVVGFTTYAMGNAIRLMASLPEMQARLMEHIDANGIAGDGPLSDGRETPRLAAWNSMLSQVMPFQFSGSGRGHAPNQDLCALAGVYAVNEAYAALNGGVLLKTAAEIAELSNEIFHGQPSAASARPNGEWWSSTGMLAEGGHDFYGYDDNYGANVTFVFLGYLARRDAIASNFLTNEYAEALQYFFVPDDDAPLGVYAEWGIARRAGSKPFDPRITPLALTQGSHPAMDRLCDLALPHFAANPDANMQFSSPHHLQIGVWGYCEMIDHLSAPTNTSFRLPAEREDAWVFQDDTLKILATKPAGGVPTYYTEIWDDPDQARRHDWDEAPETIPSLGVFP